ncbi:MAG: zinc metalloprotease HtpX [Dehalococcoidia bacterium]
MRMRQWYHDGGLQARMMVVYALLGAVYLAFMAALYWAGVPVLFIVLIAGGLLFVQYFFSDKMVLASMGAHEVSPQQAPELHAMVGRLAQQMDLPMPKVALMDTPMANAFATGRNPQNAVVCVTTGIMNRLDRDELEAVLGHELSHVKNRDVQVITIASFFATIASFIMQWGLWLGIGGSRDNENRGAGGVMLVYLASVVTWIVSFFLIRALSRYRELAADRGAVVVTGAPSTLASALVKISNSMARIPEQDLRQTGALNAFFIIPAARGFSLSELMSTHPSLERRLEQLQHMQRQMEGVR